MARSAPPEARSAVREGPARSDECVLNIPPQPGYVGVARLFVTTLARRTRCDEESIGDLKIAISEVCTGAVRAHAGAGIDAPVRVRARSGPAGLVVEITVRGTSFRISSFADGAGPAPAGGFSEGSLPLEIVKGLFPDVRIVRDEEGSSRITFSVPVTPHGGG